VIGLGDRHCDNILLRINDGEIIHIDFDCLFDKGRNLPCPELVQIRLTKNFEAVFGSFKCAGLFNLYFKEISKIFAKNAAYLMGALDSFIYDPLINDLQTFSP